MSVAAAAEQHAAAELQSVDLEKHDIDTGGKRLDERLQELKLLYAEEVQDYFRTFEILRHYLEVPSSVRMQPTMCPIPDTVQQSELINRFYGFEHAFFREMMGHKLTKTFRSNLDDISDTHRLSLKSCRRQFDNLFRIFSRIDDIPTYRGNLTASIMKDFLLKARLARSYAAAVFLLFHRFDLETSRKKFQFLSWDDCEALAHCIMSLWLSENGLVYDDDEDPVPVAGDFAEQVIQREGSTRVFELAHRCCGDFNFVRLCSKSS